ncbi:MAG: ATP-binding protein [Deltaproteobacteria bacterium]|nr:ATP-binding protein [Deltaproteobacteria bacterium]
MLTKTLPARMDSLHELLAFISGYAEKKGFTQDSLNRIQLVAEEALVNIFHYAYAHQTDDQVEVRLMETDGPALRVEIRDKGNPFDPLSLGEPDVAADISERRIGGMGVFLIRKMADEVRYGREKDTNILNLTFFNRR